MPKWSRNGLERGEQAVRDEPPGQDGPIWDDFVTVTLEGDEELVADVRRLVTPGQMVERKLLTLLGGGGPGLAAQAEGVSSNPQGPEGRS